MSSYISWIFLSLSAENILNSYSSSVVGFYQINTNSTFIPLSPPSMEVECREKFFTNSLTSHQIFYILLCAFEPPRGTSKPFSQSPNTNSKDPLSNEYLCPLTLPWRTASGSVYLLAWRAKLTSPFFFVLSFVFCLYRAKYVAYGGTQVRDLIRTVAACLHHSYSNTRSKPCLQPTPQLMAMLDP